jgi:hypothetical protein
VLLPAGGAAVVLEGAGAVVVSGVGAVVVLAGAGAVEVGSVGVVGEDNVEAAAAVDPVGSCSFCPTRKLRGSEMLFNFIKSAVFTPSFLAIFAGESPACTMYTPASGAALAVLVDGAADALLAMLALPPAGSVSTWPVRMLFEVK